jgi:hypothetical protein
MRVRVRRPVFNMRHATSDNCFSNVLGFPFLWQHWHTNIVISDKVDGGIRNYEQPSLLSLLESTYCMIQRRADGKTL